MDRLSHLNLWWLCSAGVAFVAACFGAVAGIGWLLNWVHGRRT
jgi:hypothetical protein